MNEGGRQGERRERGMREGGREREMREGGRERERERHRGGREKERERHGQVDATLPFEAVDYLPYALDLRERILY